MKTEKNFPLVGLAVPLFCAWQARDLINAWRHSPHDRLGWLALLVWLAPVARRVAGKARAELSASFILMGAAIGCGRLWRGCRFSAGGWRRFPKH